MIEDLATCLKLPYIKSTYQKVIEEAKHTNQSYELFLQELLLREVEHRKNNAIDSRIKKSKFPYLKYLEDFNRKNYHPEFATKFDELETLSFIKKKENMILIGTPGSGKTHYSIGIMMKALIGGMTGLFVSVPDLVIELKEALDQRVFNSYKKRFEKYDLVILDELGYTSFDKEGSELLFNLLSHRSYKGSVIITSNLVFERWNEVFNDTMLTGALVDRLAHRAHILDISLETSMRYQDTINWLKSK
jgi:DNA replication protein DnaC